METLITFKTAKLAKDRGFSSCLKSTIIISWSQDRDYRTQIPYEPNCFLNGEYFEDYEYSREEFKTLFKDDDSYSADVQIPSQSVLANWLLENHGIFVTVEIAYNEWGRYSAGIYRKAKDGKTAMLAQDGMTIFDNPHDSMEEGLQEALNLI